MPGRDLGHQVSANGDEPVAGPPEAHPAPKHRPFVVGLGAVLVEERRPRLRLHPQFVGAGAHRARVAGAEGGGNEFALGGRERGRVGDAPGPIELADDRARSIGPEVAVGERGRDARELGLERLAGEPDPAAGRRPERDAPPRLGTRHLGHPLDEL